MINSFNIFFTVNSVRTFGIYMIKKNQLSDYIFLIFFALFSTTFGTDNDAPMDDLDMFAYEVKDEHHAPLNTRSVSATFAADFEFFIR